MHATSDESGHQDDRVEQVDSAFDVWIRHNPDGIERWEAAGWDLRQAFVWQRAGFDPSDAHAWADVIESRRIPNRGPVTNPGDWWTQTSAAADYARACVKAGFAPADHDAMAAVFTDPSDAREWLDAGLSVLEAGE